MNCTHFFVETAVRGGKRKDDHDAKNTLKALTEEGMHK